METRSSIRPGTCRLRSSRTRSAMAADPSYAAKRGYEVIRERPHRDPPSPGEHNALGFIKFMFPNQHAVYLHDTPSRNLFRRRPRLQPRLRPRRPAVPPRRRCPGAAWSESRLRSLIGRGERKTTAQTPARASHLLYDHGDEHGALRSIEDLYGINRRARRSRLWGIKPARQWQFRHRSSLSAALEDRLRRA